MDTEPTTDRRVRVRRAVDEAMRHWDHLQEKVPAPLLRVLVTLPWLLRRMPVPLWVPVALMVLRRIARRRGRRREKFAGRA
jgi:hypothetical protein